MVDSWTGCSPAAITDIETSRSCCAVEVISKSLEESLSSSEEEPTVISTLARLEAVLEGIIQVGAVEWGIRESRSQMQEAVCC